MPGKLLCERSMDMKRFRNFFRYLIIVALDVLIMVTFHSYINFLILIGLIISHLSKKGKRLPMLPVLDN